MVKVNISGRLIADYLCTGAVIPRCEIGLGLPEGSVLIGADFKLGVLELFFDDAACKSQACAVNEISILVRNG